MLPHTMLFYSNLHLYQDIRKNILKHTHNSEVLTIMECNGNVLMYTQWCMFEISTDDKGASDSCIN